MTISTEEFAVPASAVFDVITDPYSYPNWLVGTLNIRRVSSDWPLTGSYFTHTVGFGPVRIPDRTTIRAIDRPRIVEMLVRARPAMEAVVRFEVTSSASGCTLRMHETPIGVFKVMSMFVKPLIRLRNERSLRRLKSMFDADAQYARSLTHERQPTVRRASGH